MSEPKMSEKKAVRRSVAIALGTICIILAVSLAGATVSTAFVSVANAQFWSWGYNVRFGKTVYDSNSVGNATISFDTITTAQVRNIILSLYFIESNGTIEIQELKDLSESPVFTFGYEKSFSFKISADSVSGTVYYDVSFDIRGPYDSTYTSEVFSMREGPKINNPSLPTYDSLQTNNTNLQTQVNDLNSQINSLGSQLNDIRAQNTNSTNLLYVAILLVVVFLATTIYFAVRRPKTKNRLSSPQLKTNQG